MPIFDSQYPVNSNPAGNDKILTTDTSDSSAVKSVTLTKVQEWLGSISKWITNGMIADGAVDTLQLANSAVTTGKIQNGAVTANKIDFTTSQYTYATNSGGNISSNTINVPYSVQESSGDFTYSNGVFTCVNPGVYQMDYNFAINESSAGASGSGEFILFQISAPGQGLLTMAPAVRSSVWRAQIGGVRRFNVGQQISVTMNVSSGLSLPISINYSSMTISRLL